MDHLKFCLISLLIMTPAYGSIIERTEAAPVNITEHIVDPYCASKASVAIVQCTSGLEGWLKNVQNGDAYSCCFIDSAVRCVHDRLDSECSDQHPGLAVNSMRTLANEEMEKCQEYLEVYSSYCIIAWIPLPCLLITVFVIVIWCIIRSRNSIACKPLRSIITCTDDACP